MPAARQTGGRRCQLVNRRVAALPRLLSACALLVVLSGCATYRPATLDLAPPLLPSLASLRHPGAALPAPLSVRAVAYLAVENNPDLRAAHARIGVAAAQVLAAGLLPNPQATASFTPVLGGPPPTFPAFSAGLSEDVRALVTLSARREAAQASALASTPTSSGRNGR
jgi:outer membrane protein TolC